MDNPPSHSFIRFFSTLMIYSLVFSIFSFFGLIYYLGFSGLINVFYALILNCLTSLFFAYMLNLISNHSVKSIGKFTRTIELILSFLFVNFCYLTLVIASASVTLDVISDKVINSSTFAGVCFSLVLFLLSSYYYIRLFKIMKKYLKQIKADDFVINPADF